MTNHAITLGPSTPITMLELPTDVCGGLKTFNGEVYRDGPYLVRVEIDYWVQSPDKLDALFAYLAATLHYQEHGKLDDCPGAFRGHLAIPDPSGSRTFSPGWYHVQMWIEDSLLFHADALLKPEAFAVKLFDTRIREALDSLCCVDTDIAVGEINVTEAAGSWLSYQLGRSATGTPIGTSARFVGPNLYDVDFVRPAVIDALDLEASASVH